MKVRLNYCYGYMRGLADDLFGIDLRTLAVFRILVGLMVLGTLTILFPDIGSFYSDEGVYPREFWNERIANVFVFSLHAVRGETGWQQLLFVLHGIFAFMLTVGWHTRFAGLMTWMLLVSLLHRNGFIVHGGDNLLCLLLLWGILTPWGARLSVDRVLGSTATLPKRALSVGTAGMILQMPIVYFFSVIHKVSDSSWRSEFTAVGYAFSPEYLTAVGEFLVVGAPDWVFSSLTVITLVIECVAPLLMFIPVLFYIDKRRQERRRWLNRFRAGGIICLTAIQLGLLATIAIGLFPLISMVGLLPLIPSAFWAKWVKRRRERRELRIKIHYDPDSKPEHIFFRFLRKILLPGPAALVSRKSAANLPSGGAGSSLAIRDGNGIWYPGFDALSGAVSRFPLFWITPPVLKLLHWPCKYLRKCLDGSTFSFLSRILEGANERRSRIETPILLRAFSVVLLIYMFASNLAHTEVISLGPKLRQAEYGLRVRQNWRMFTSPMKWSSYYVLEARTVEGMTVDLFGAGGPVFFGADPVRELTWEKPASQRSAAIFRNYRWRKYFEAIRRDRNTEARRYYMEHISRNWNREHRAGDRIEYMRLYRMVQTRDWLNQPLLDEPERILLLEHRSFNASESAEFAN